MTDFDPLDTFREYVGEPDRARRDRIRAEFRTRVATLPADSQGRRPFDPPPTPSGAHRRVRQPVLALASLVVALGLITGGALWLRDGATTAPLEQLASAAASQSDTALDDGQYLHRSEQASDEQGPVMREEWTASNGTGQNVVTSLAIGPSGSTVPSLTVFTAAGSLQFAGVTYDELRSLPTDADAPLPELRRLGAVQGDGAAAEAEALADVLALDVTPPEVAAATVNALGTLGGSVSGPMTDAAGRTGSAVEGLNGDGTRWIVLLDSTTGRALAFYPSVAPATDLSAAVPHRAWIDQDITTSIPPSN